MDKYDIIAVEQARGRLRGNITITEHRGGAEGDVVVYKGTNLITDAGLAWFMDRAVSNGVNPVSHVGIGDDITTPDTTDITLGNEVFRKVASSVTSPSLSLSVEAFISSSEALFNWKELGLFNNATAGTLINHLLLDYVHGAIDVTVVLTISAADDGV